MMQQPFNCTTTFLNRLIVRQNFQIGTQIGSFGRKPNWNTGARQAFRQKSLFYF